MADAPLQNRPQNLAASSAEKGTIAPSAPQPAALVRAESNLLHLPYFYLQTKGLKNVKFIAVTGTKTVNDEEYEFTYRVSRNSELVYPGLQSRGIHFSLLGILQDPAKGTFPFENPVRFSWRELARRSRLKWAGRTTINRMKEAIACTHGAVITSNSALMFRSDGDKLPLPTRKRGYHLYERYGFVNEDNTDENFVVFADWYMSNLNALMSGPIDNDLWHAINSESPVASRVYEYLKYKCSGGIPKLRINYVNFAPFLPVVTQAYPAKAKEKLDPVFSVCRKYGVIERWRWSTSRDGLIQLHIYPGSELKSTIGPALEIDATMQQDLLDDLSVTVGSNDDTPESLLVADFHRRWSNNDCHRSQKGELDFASELIQDVGEDVAKKLLPRVVRSMKQEKGGFRTAKTFGACRMYFEQHIQQFKKESERLVREAQENRRKQREAEERRIRIAEEEARDKVLTELWNGYSFDKRCKILDQILQTIDSDFELSLFRRQTREFRTSKARSVVNTVQLRSFLLPYLDENLND